MEVDKNKKKTNTLKKATKVDVKISGPLYDSSYAYDSTRKRYNRSQGGAAHMDREAGQITPKVVIVMKVPTKIGFEDGYREQMTTIGSGEAHIFQNGKHQSVTWKKAAKKSQIKFLDSNKKEIPLERGQTWITVIAPNRSVTWQ